MHTAPNRKRAKGPTITLLVVLGLLTSIGVGAAAQERVGTPPVEAGNQAITTAATAMDLVNAMMSDTALVSGASFVTEAGAAGRAVADSGTALGGFPVQGSTYAMLSSGAATSADDPNNSGSTTTNLPGGSFRGVNDVTVLQVDFGFTPGDEGTPNCLTLDFRFLSEEFPEYVGSSYNDAFLAEWGANSWSVSGTTISAPANFAFDEFGNVISINSAGAATMSAAEAAGTTYDGATTLLRATTPIAAGDTPSLFLTIFDMGDSSWDSTVFLDRLALGTATAGNCEPGVIVAPPPSPAGPPPWFFLCFDHPDSALSSLGIMEARQGDSDPDCQNTTETILGSGAGSFGNCQVWASDFAAAMNLPFHFDGWVGNVDANENTALFGTTYEQRVGIFDPSSPPTDPFDPTDPAYEVDGQTRFVDAAADEEVGTFQGNVPSKAGTFTVPNGAYLLFILCNPTSTDLVVQTDGGTWVDRPAGDPAFPTPELSVLILSALGLLGVGAFVARRRRK